MTQQEVQEQIVELARAGDRRAFPVALEAFAASPSATTTRLLELAARSRGFVLPSRHHPDHLAVRFTYSLETKVAEILDPLPEVMRTECLAVLGRRPEYNRTRTRRR